MLVVIAFVAVLIGYIVFNKDDIVKYLNGQQPTAPVQSQKTAAKAPSTSASAPKSTEITKAPVVDYAAARKKAAAYKKIFHELHNLEYHPQALSDARDMLLTYFAQVLAEGQGRIKKGERNILSIEKFNAEELAKYLRSEDDKISDRFEEYAAGRHRGAPRQLFQNKEEATRWLASKAPSKLVDGAWLGHIHRAQTPFNMRNITKDAWQIFSEELGDGDIDKHHAYVYDELLAKVGAPVPSANTKEFVTKPHLPGFDPKDDNMEVWQSAVSQLLISLFPNEFLPEILGFNMQFEMITWDTVRAAKELKEVGYDGYYFLLHISIDNADSGHTAMALKVVLDYLDWVMKNEGPAAHEQAWRRIQVGYLLSDKFAVSHAGAEDDEAAGAIRYHNDYSSELLRIFKGKAEIAGKLHCGSRVKIGGKTLNELLDIRTLQTPEGETAFLKAMADSKAWVKPGDHKSSRLIQQFEWMGKMFGAVTMEELVVVKAWIDNLAPSTSSRVPGQRYWNFVKMAPVSSEDAFNKMDVRTSYPVFSEKGLTTPWKNVKKAANPIAAGDVAAIPKALASNGSLSKTLRTGSANSVKLNKFLPLWFAHPAVLEGFTAVPNHTCTKAMMAILRVMRAQRGFAPEGLGVAGMDEMKREKEQINGLTEIGLEMVTAAGFDKPAGIADVLKLDNTADSFSEQLLHWSMRPLEHHDALLGFAWAFSELHQELANSDALAAAVGKILTPATRKNLASMYQREREGLAEALADRASRVGISEDFFSAANMARAEIAQCFA